MQSDSGAGVGPPVVASAARALGVGMWPTFVGAVPGSWFCIEDDVAAFDSGTDIARFNAVAAPMAAATPATVGRLVEDLATRTDWFSLHTPVPCSRALREMAHGLHLIEEQEPLMLLEDPRHLVTAANRSNAEISRLRPDEVERHVDVWARGFGVPAEALDPWLRSDLLNRPNVIAYQASVDAEDVATALGIVADGFVGVFNVACVESHRRRGYGAALTAKVVIDGLSAAPRWRFLPRAPRGRASTGHWGFVRSPDGRSGYLRTLNRTEVRNRRVGASSAPPAMLAYRCGLALAGRCCCSCISGQ